MLIPVQRLNTTTSSSKASEEPQLHQLKLTEQPTSPSEKMPQSHSWGIPVQSPRPQDAFTERSSSPPKIPVQRLVLITREKVMAEGAKVLEKLGNREYDQTDLGVDIYAWLDNEHYVNVLPNDVKNKLHFWGRNYYGPEIMDLVRQADEDSLEDSLFFSFLKHHQVVCDWDSCVGFLEGMTDNLNTIATKAGGDTKSSLELFRKDLDNIRDIMGNHSAWARKSSKVAGGAQSRNLTDMEEKIEKLEAIGRDGAEIIKKQDEAIKEITDAFEKLYVKSESLVWNSDVRDQIKKCDDRILDEEGKLRRETASLRARFEAASQDSHSVAAALPTWDKRRDSQRAVVSGWPGWVSSGRCDGIATPATDYGSGSGPVVERSGSPSLWW
ncbi:hypothetical protein B0T10DRAFT_606964 [Thelonectria olida]|uniref:Uncharacterized protein n=1 Tax=Thelonectria olida TaxID=1576542 RepID=A0A9P9ANU4_9HYPO|nr:hypothetical protein B0T10DRAFT_606964 [Thelonectria olida]